MKHNAFTHMLFVDAIVGAGTEHLSLQVQKAALKAGLIHTQGIGAPDAWNRTALESFDSPTLHEMYSALKLQEVTNAS